MMVYEWKKNFSFRWSSNLWTYKESIKLYKKLEPDFTYIPYLFFIPILFFVAYLIFNIQILLAVSLLLCILFIVTIEEDIRPPNILLLATSREETLSLQKRIETFYKVLQR
jgi:hypothetical protein